VGMIHFAISLGATAAPAYIQVVTPRHARGQVSAAYLLVLNALGLGVGPVLIGWLSSLSGNDAHALRAAVTEVIIPSLMAAMLLFGLFAWRESRQDPSAVSEKAPVL